MTQSIISYGVTLVAAQVRQAHIDIVYSNFAITEVARYSNEGLAPKHVYPSQFDPMICLRLPQDLHQRMEPTEVAIALLVSLSQFENWIQ
jgi:hypothetical protein